METQKTLDERQNPTITAPDYSDLEMQYIGILRNKMARARDIRENEHDEFDGMTYTQRCEWNRKGANTYIQPKRNKDDTTFVTGVTNEKMTLIHSYLMNLNLTPEVMAWNESALKDNDMAISFEDIIIKTYYDEDDDEKIAARQRVMLEQGEVFLEEVWETGTVKLKRFVEAFNGQNFDTAKWITQHKKKPGRPVHNIIQNENVFLGDITVFGIENQPFIFTVQQLPYELVEEEYGTWKRWESVQKKVQYFSYASQAQGTVYNNNWSLTKLQEDHCEVIKYQDRFNNEYAVIINGILMTPVGLPLPWQWGDEPQYNITMQVLWIISPFFAYGKSVPMIMRTKQLLNDEFWRLMILKTQKSFIPSYANMTGVQLSNRIFMPGKMTHGIDADKIKRLDPEGSIGVTRAEMQVVQELQKSIDNDTASASITGVGSQGGGRQTATQRRQMQSQAELMVVLIVFAASTLERKLGQARLYNVLENWFRPLKSEEVKIDDARKELKNTYRTMNLDKMIDNEGPGQSIVRIGPAQDGADIYREEEDIKMRTGVPTRIHTIDPDVVQGGKYTFRVNVIHKEKKTSDLGKIMFKEMMDGAMQYFPDTLNKEEMQKEYATVWRQNPMKMFKQAQPQQGDQGGGDQQQPPQPTAGGQGARGKLMPKTLIEAGKAPTPTPPGQAAVGMM